MTPPPGRRSVLTAPYVACAGFLLLLAAVFAASYGVGTLSGPVAPDMRGVSHQNDDPDMGDMGGTGHGGDH
ncbi:hypothetical protein ABZ826_35210 [Streptomyces sp. NPDC047515]|uniref:hypothetical protein n=1 Tax=Streptomyces sp. NPDC047515 TaxID=3155380 RepID=UPI0033FB1802